MSIGEQFVCFFDWKQLCSTIEKKISQGLSSPFIRFLSEIDESLEASRKIFRDFDLLTHGPKAEDVDWEQVQVIEHEISKDLAQTRLLVRA